MVLLAVAVAPGIFWLWYFQRRDRLRPEPRHLVQRVFLFGAGAAFAAGLLEAGAFPLLGMSGKGSTLADAVAAAAVVAIVEETLKFLVVLQVAYRHAAFDEVLDGIVYAVTASLGFATVENIFYVVEGGLGVGVLRAVLSVPGHAFFGALMGFAMGLAKFSRSRERLLLFAGFGWAAIAHTLYDAVLFSETTLALAVVPIVLILWRRAMTHSRRALAMDDDRIGRQRLDNHNR